MTPAAAPRHDVWQPASEARFAPDETRVRSEDGTELRILRRRPAARREGDPPPERRAALAIVHGYADHAGRYDHVMERFAGDGFVVYAVDLRGHGRSEGRRGHVRRWADYLDDADALLSAIARDEPALPLFLHGHSLGGLVVLSHLIERAGREPGSRVRAASVTSPFLGIAAPPPALKLALGRVAGLLAPTLALPNEIDPANLSREPGVGRIYASDPLVFKTVTAGWFREATRAIARVESDVERVRVPTLVLQAGADRVADPKKSKPLFDRMRCEPKRYEEYPEFFHEILNERGWEAAAETMREWYDRNGAIPPTR